MSDIGACHVSSAAHLCLTSPSLWADGIRVFSLVDTAAFWMPYTILEHCISQWCRTFLILGDISERYSRQHGVAAIRLLRGVFATAPRFLPRTVHAAAQEVLGFFGLDFEASALQPHRMYLATKSGTIGKVSWGHYNGVSGRVHCRAFAWYMGRVSGAGVVAQAGAGRSCYPDGVVSGASRVVRSQLRSSDVLACQQGVPGDVQENRSTWASALKTRKGKKKGKNHCFWGKIPRRGTGVRERRQAWDNKGYSAWDTGNDWAGHEAWRRITPQARWVWDTSSTASVASEAGCQHLSVLALGGQDHMHEQSVWPISLYFGTKVWEGRQDMARASFGSSHAGRCFATTGRGRDHGPLDRRSEWLPRLGKLSGLALLSLMGHFHFLALMTF